MPLSIYGGAELPSLRTIIWLLVPCRDPFNERDVARERQWGAAEIYMQIWDGCAAVSGVQQMFRRLWGCLKSAGMVGAFGEE